MDLSAGRLLQRNITASTVRRVRPLRALEYIKGLDSFIHPVQCKLARFRTEIMKFASFIFFLFMNYIRLRTDFKFAPRLHL